MVDKPEEKPKSGRGGKRPGAGRKRKAFVAPTVVSEVEFAALLAMPAPDEIDAVAQADATASIAAMARQMVFGTSEPAKIAACVIILDRGYGKPAVEIGGDALAPMLPLMLAPQSSAAGHISTTAELRAEARKFATLALETLRRIRDNGISESARVAAGRALLDRGYGTTAKARMPDEQRERSLGKKEEAQRAAEAAATGRYATPPPPRRAAERMQ